MRIVMAANWWYRRGGLGAVMLDEARGLEARGHDVFPFAAAHPDNLPTARRDDFPRFRETQGAGAGLSVGESVRTAANLIYNVDAGRRLGRLLDDVRPDVLHLHNVSRQLSPSVVRQAARRYVPVVITAHDYSLVCPQGQLYRGDSEPCTPPNCMRGDVWNAIASHCVKRSRVASTVAAAEYLIHRSLGLYTSCDLIIAPSAFMARMLVRGGIAARRIAVLPNGIEPGSPPAPVRDEGGYVLYSGRLAREKGLDTLLAASAMLPMVPFVVAGDGPEGSRLRATAGPNVQFVGHQNPAELADLLAGCVAVALPSDWYENAPISLLEALRAGRPVVATSVGGHPEMLASGGGILVGPRDPGALAAAIDSLWSDRPAARRHGQDGRVRLERDYALADHIERLLTCYAKVVAGGTAAPRDHRATSSDRRA